MTPEPYAALAEGTRGYLVDANVRREAIFTNREVVSAELTTTWPAERFQLRFDPPMNIAFRPDEAATLERAYVEPHFGQNRLVLRMADLTRAGDTAYVEVASVQWPVDGEPIVEGGDPGWWATMAVVAVRIAAGLEAGTLVPHGEPDVDGIVALRIAEDPQPGRRPRGRRGLGVSAWKSP